MKDHILENSIKIIRNLMEEGRLQMQLVMEKSLLGIIYTLAHLQFFLPKEEKRIQLGQRFS
jgi:hypothetical protein